MERLNAAAQAGDIDALYASYSPFKMPIILPNMERLNAAAEAGDIDALYARIREDARLLKCIDELPVIDTPLHIAASRGHTNFAMEIANLMPSYARKLNQDGFSPMHLALKNENNDLVLFLADLDKDLIHVKGRNGMTPLHYAAGEEKLHFLSKFLAACPQCIKDVTFQGETALHIALKQNKAKAFRVLMGWIRRSTHKDARDYEDLVLNWRDNGGNSVLHIAAYKGHADFVELLLHSKLVDANTENNDKLTPMGIAKESDNGEIMEKLRWRGMLKYFLGVKTLEKHLMSKISFLGMIGIHVKREREIITNDSRDALLVVFILVVTENFEAALSPPGGLWQGQLNNNAPMPGIFHVDGDKLDTKSSLEAPPPASMGTIIMDPDSFVVMWLLNTVTFLVTFMLILFLFPSGSRKLLFLPVCLMAVCYMLSMSVVSPRRHWSTVNAEWFLPLITLIYVLTWFWPLKEMRTRKFQRVWGSSYIF